MSLLSNIIGAKEENLNLSDFIVFMGMVIFAPVIEELIFRLILRPGSVNIALYSIFAFIVFIFSIFKHNSQLMTFSFILAGFFAYILSGKKKIVKMQWLILRHYKFFFYFICVLFGLVHIFNFEFITFKIVLLAPFLIFPQIVCGGFLGFIRLKYGLIYSMLFHSLINLVPALFMLSKVN